MSESQNSDNEQKRDEQASQQLGTSQFLLTEMQDVKSRLHKLDQKLWLMWTAFIIAFGDSWVVKAISKAMEEVGK